MFASLVAVAPAQEPAGFTDAAVESQLRPGSAACRSGPLSSPLTLFEAVSRALCENPKTRGAWADIKLNAAQVSISKEAYTPSVGVTAKEQDSATQTIVSHIPLLDTSARAAYLDTSLSINWVLFDFGQRHDQLEADRELLAAARANLDLNLQEVFLQTASDFYDAQAAQASLDSTVEIEQLTERSVGAAHVRVQNGVAPVSDELQAQTAHAQAIVNRVKAQEDLNAKRGALCNDMGISPDRVITLTQAVAEVDPQPEFTQTLHALIEEAKRNHPGVILAERELDSARAAAKAARAHLLPTISAVAGVSYTNEPLAPSLGSPSVPGNVANKFYGLEIDVPLSEPLWRRGVVAKARAQVEVQEETLYEAEQEVAKQVWASYISLQASTENLANSKMLVDSSLQSLESTQRRYEGGVGNILELLSSQSAYANARQQRIRSLSDWRTARLALAGSLGRLNLEAIEDQH